MSRAEQVNTIFDINAFYLVHFAVKLPNQLSNNEIKNSFLSCLDSGQRLQIFSILESVISQQMYESMICIVIISTIKII